jgi:hypothetical protein
MASIMVSPAAAWYFLIQNFSFLRSQSAKTKNDKKIEYHSAACPELAEGKAKGADRISRVN